MLGGLLKALGLDIWPFGREKTNTGASLVGSPTTYMRLLVASALPLCWARMTSPDCD